MKFNSAVKPERGNEFLVDLADIAVDHTQNTRFVQSDITNLTQSISQYGQLQAVGCVRVKPTNTLRLAYGFGRYEAIKRINEGLLPDEQMKIKVVIFDGNDRDVFLRNLAENAHRNSLSHMDYALAIRKLKENIGQNDSQIAGFFGKTKLWVIQHRALLSLDYRIQEKVHVGEITLTDALAIAKLPEEKQTEVATVIAAAVQEEPATVVEVDTVDSVTEDGGEPAEQEVAAAPAAKAEEIKAKKKKIKSAIKGVTGEKKRRTWNDMHNFFQIMIGSPAISDELQKLASVMIAIMNGELDDDSQAVDALETILGVLDAE